MDSDDADAAPAANASWSATPGHDGNALERSGRGEAAAAGSTGGRDAARQGLLDRDEHRARVPDAADDENPNALPAALARHYQRAENRYYFRGQGRALAFEDQGERIATPHHHPEVARAMVELAHAKGWQAVVVRGSDAFKREAWLQARLRGMAVEGFRPRDIDLARLDARQTQHESPQRTTAPNEDARPEPPAAQHADQGTADPAHPSRHEAALEALATILQRRGDSVEQVAAATDLARQWFQTEQLYRGRIVEVGRAAYGFDARSAPSHFVRLALPQGGTEVVWGGDLERALAASGAGVDDRVVLAGYVMRTPAGRETASDSAGPVSDRARDVAERTVWTVTPVDRQRALRRSPLASAERARAGDRATTAVPWEASRSAAAPRPAARMRDRSPRSR